MVQPPLEAIGQQLQARPDIADHFALRKVDPLYIGRRVADVNYLRTFRAHDEWRFFDGVVTNGDNQIGPVNRFMNVVALAERGGPHVEIAAAGYRSLAHLCGEERNFRAAPEAADASRAARPGRGSAEHD